MWQVLLQDTSFWTCFWFLFAATLQMSLGPWKVLAIAYMYSSVEFIVASSVDYLLPPELTLFAYKVAVIVGIVFGSAVQSKGSPWLTLALLPGLTLYLDPRAMYGVAAVYLVACLLFKYYTWAMYILCTCLTCILLPMQIGGAPLVGMTAPVVFGFMYAHLNDGPE